ncbi:MAG: hypothetical protein R3D83_09350 [Caenibius sp.]
MDLAEKVVWVVPREDSQWRPRQMAGRAVPVHDYVLNMYVDYLTSDEYLPAFESGAEYVFANVKVGMIGHAMSLSYARKLAGLLEQRTHIDFSWHMFRHSHASEAIAAGQPARSGRSPRTCQPADNGRVLPAPVRLGNPQALPPGPDEVHERLEKLREAELLRRDMRWA